jgi:hypothetical protein
MDKEAQTREHVKDLKSLYTNLLTYGTVTIACLLIWAMTGGGYFWPIWVFFALGGSAIAQAVRLGRVSIIHQYFPFLSPEWEDKQVKKLMETPDKIVDGTSEKTKGGTPKKL